VSELLSTLYYRSITSDVEYILNMNILQWWSICYYQCCYEEERMPEVPDSTFDHVYRMVEAWEKLHPDKINRYSPTQLVGYGECLDDDIKDIVRKHYIGVQEGLKRRPNRC